MKADGKHAKHCTACGRETYRASLLCRRCDPEATGLADPGNLPEDYLMRCAEELLKRHSARAEMLARLGMREAA